MFFLAGFLVAVIPAGVFIAIMAWLTMHGWNIVVVGILELSRLITFWEAFVVYIIIACIANLFRSK